MKVKISKYRDRCISRVHDQYMDKKYGKYVWSDNTTKFESALEKFEGVLQSVYNNTINLILDGRASQKVKVRIDEFDTWGMDHTLAHIIVPMLKQLRDTKQGSPCVDYNDVPEELRPNEAEVELYKTKGETDIHFWARWDWVLNEMIFAFESKLEDWEERFRSGEHDLNWISGEDGMSELVKGPNDTFKIDHEGRKAYQERISNGFRLFGKYYESLWD